MGCIIIEQKHKINPFMKKKFFLELLCFGHRNFTSSKIKISAIAEIV